MAGRQTSSLARVGSWALALVLTVAYGAAALALLTAEAFATTLAVACCGFVSVRNEAAVRAYEQAGFRWRRIWLQHRPRHFHLFVDVGREFGLR